MTWREDGPPPLEDFLGLIVERVRPELSIRRRRPVDRDVNKIAAFFARTG